MTKDEALSTISALKMCLEYIETNAHERRFVRHAIKEALNAPLAQPPVPEAHKQEPEHHDPIGDAQDKLIAEQVASHNYRTRYDRGCYKCGSHYCPADCPMPTHLAPQQPQMQPCAGRNCGSTNPNLHSAECFEDYEKATGMNKWQGLTDEEYTSLAHRIASKYSHRSDLSYVAYTFLPHTLEQFVRSVEAKHGIYAPTELKESE